MVVHQTKNKGVLKQRLSDVIQQCRFYIDNSLDSEITPQSKSQIVKDARSQLGRQEHDIFTRNCEHFANWCRYEDCQQGQEQGIETERTTLQEASRPRVETAIGEHSNVSAVSAPPATDDSFNHKPSATGANDNRHPPTEEGVRGQEQGIETERTTLQEASRPRVETAIGEHSNVSAVSAPPATDDSSNHKPSATGANDNRHPPTEEGVRVVYRDSKQDEIKEGDILKFYRRLFCHFAIYTGDGMVIHRTKDKEVVGEKLSDVIQQCSFYIDNRRDKEMRPKSKSRIVKNARSRLGEKDYEPFTNNCDHFATWCRYGKAGGIQ
ncbi:uncharacterized protein LOC124272761, partial [Haliotis rubra]|uniref:uncharacterized protein LOC124272761 n=1 Tax=Haliotis rubra TaxID=36100 RepID=UPI001EE593AA